MLFSFEGIDGSGKSTQARLLADSLRQHGWEVVEVREPGGTKLGEQIRSLLLDPGAIIHERSELLLFSAARAQLVVEVIEPALARGAVVIADRFYDSSTAYQGGGRGLADVTWMNDLHQFATNGCSPDRTYLIDIRPSVAASRRMERHADRMEAGGLDFYDRVRTAYLALEDASRVLVLDGSASVETLQLCIQTDALDLLTSRA